MARSLPSSRSLAVGLLLVAAAAAVVGRIVLPDLRAQFQGFEEFTGQGGGAMVYCCLKPAGGEVGTVTGLISEAECKSKPDHNSFSASEDNANIACGIKRYFCVSRNDPTAAPHCEELLQSPADGEVGYGDPGLCAVYCTEETALTACNECAKRCERQNELGKDCNASNCSDNTPNCVFEPYEEGQHQQKQVRLSNSESKTVTNWGVCKPNPAMCAGSSSSRSTSAATSKSGSSRPAEEGLVYACCLPPSGEIAVAPVEGDEGLDMSEFDEYTTVLDNSLELDFYCTHFNGALATLLEYPFNPQDLVSFSSDCREARPANVQANRPNQPAFPQLPLAAGGLGNLMIGFGPNGGGNNVVPVNNFPGANPNGGNNAIPPNNFLGGNPLGDVAGNVADGGGLGNQIIGGNPVGNDNNVPVGNNPRNPNGGNNAIPPNNFLGGNPLGDIFGNAVDGGNGQIFGGNLPNNAAGGNIPVGNLPGGNIPGGNGNIPVGNIPGGNPNGGGNVIPVGNLPGGNPNGGNNNIPVGNLPGGNIPGGNPNGNNLRDFPDNDDDPFNDDQNPPNPNGGSNVIPVGNLRGGNPNGNIPVGNQVVINPGGNGNIPMGNQNSGPPIVIPPSGNQGQNPPGNPSSSNASGGGSASSKPAEYGYYSCSVAIKAFTGPMCRDSLGVITEEQAGEETIFRKAPLTGTGPGVGKSVCDSRCSQIGSTKAYCLMGNGCALRPFGTCTVEGFAQFSDKSLCRGVARAGCLAEGRKSEDCEALFPST